MEGERIFRILYLPVMYSGVGQYKQVFLLSTKQKKLFLTILEGLA